MRLAALLLLTACGGTAERGREVYDAWLTAHPLDWPTSQCEMVLAVDGGTLCGEWLTGSLESGLQTAEFQTQPAFTSAGWFEARLLNSDLWLVGQLRSARRGKTLPPNVDPPPPAPHPEK